MIIVCLMLMLVNILIIMIGAKQCTDLSNEEIVKAVGEGILLSSFFIIPILFIMALM